MAENEDGRTREAYSAANGFAVGRPDEGRDEARDGTMEQRADGRVMMQLQRDRMV